MTIELKMPALSPTMETGTLARWLVGPGDAIAPGDVIAEIETDKATMELESADEGWVGELLVAAGTDDVAVGTPIALLTTARPSEASESAVAGPPSPLPAPPPEGGGETAQAQPIASPATREKATAEAAPDISGDATPLAARYARARGIDLPAGRARVSIRDLVAGPAHLASATAETRSAAGSILKAPNDYSASEIEDIPHSRTPLSEMQRTTVRQRTKSHQEVPRTSFTMHVRFDALIELRAQLNEALAPAGIKLSINDLVIKTLAFALIAEPSCNVRYTPDALICFERADITVAVSVPEGVQTPVVVGADRQSLTAISTTMRDLAKGARAGTLERETYIGGTATLSNLGMWGIDASVAAPNSPHATTLAIGAARRRPWDVDGEIKLAAVATVTGSFDDRAIVGADAARFLGTFCALLEQPLVLVS